MDNTGTETNTDGFTMEANTDMELMTITGADGIPFEVYTKTYTHNSYDEEFNEGSTSNVTMMFNPKTGASIVGNPYEGYNLYVPADAEIYGGAENGKIVRQYAVNTTGSIEDFAYLLNSDFPNSDDANGALGTGAVSEYGPNGELVPQDAAQVYGQTKTIIIDGKEVEICTTNPERDNLFSELTGDTSEGGSSSRPEFSSVSSTNSATSGGNTTSGGSNGAGGTTGYSSGGSGNGMFERGLRGEADETFPWLDVSIADQFRDGFVNLEYFNDSSCDFTTFQQKIQDILDITNKQGCFFTNPLTNAPQEEGGRQKTELESARDQVGEYRNVKSSIDWNAFRTDIVTYNDNVEYAKAQNERAALRAACERYNQEKHVIRYDNTYDAEGNIVSQTPVYDKIEYDAFIDAIDLISLFDMKCDEMVRALESRGIQVNLEDRPDWTR